jgi:hypothetical protein
MSLSARLYFQVELRAVTLSRSGFQPAELRDHLLRQAVTQVFLVRVTERLSKGRTASVSLRPGWVRGLGRPPTQ